MKLWSIIPEMMCWCASSVHQLVFCWAIDQRARVCVRNDALVDGLHVSPPSRRNMDVHCPRVRCPQPDGRCQSPVSLPLVELNIRRNRASRLRPPAGAAFQGRFILSRTFVRSNMQTSHPFSGCCFFFVFVRERRTLRYSPEEAAKVLRDDPSNRVKIFL